MGFEVGAALAIAGAVGKASFGVQASEMRLSALELEGKQKTIEFQQKTLRNYDQVKKVVDAQTATATALGYTGASQSLQAIQMDTFRTGAEEQENLNIENEISQLSIELEKKSVKTSLFAQLFGDVLGGASDVYSLDQKRAKKGG